MDSPASVLAKYGKFYAHCADFDDRRVLFEYGENDLKRILTVLDKLDQCSECATGSHDNDHPHLHEKKEDNKEPDYLLELETERKNLNTSMHDLDALFRRLIIAHGKMEDPDADPAELMRRPFWKNITEEELREDIDNVPEEDLSKIKERLKIEYRDTCLYDMQNWWIVLDERIREYFLRMTQENEDVEYMRPVLHTAIKKRFEQIFEGPSST